MVDAHWLNCCIVTLINMHEFKCMYELLFGCITLVLCDVTKSINRCNFLWFRSSRSRSRSRSHTGHSRGDRKRERRSRSRSRERRSVSLISLSNSLSDLANHYWLLYFALTIDYFGHLIVRLASSISHISGVLAAVGHGLVIRTAGLVSFSSHQPYLIINASFSLFFLFFSWGPLALWSRLFCFCFVYEFMHLCPACGIHFQSFHRNPATRPTCSRGWRKRRRRFGDKTKRLPDSWRSSSQVSEWVRRGWVDDW